MSKGVKKKVKKCEKRGYSLFYSLGGGRHMQIEKAASII